MRQSRDITKWSTPSLYKLLGLSSSDADAKTIDARIDELITRARAIGDTATIAFYEQARNKLISSLTIEAKGRAEQVGAPTDAPHQQRHVTSVFDVQYAQGSTNNLLKQVLPKIIFVDSSERPQLSESSSRFQFFLETPVKSVVKLSLDSISLPSRIMNIGPSLGNCYFKINQDSISTVAPGAYDLTTVAGVNRLSSAMFGTIEADGAGYLKSQAHSPPEPLYYLSLSESTSNIIITVISSDEGPTTFTWYDEEIAEHAEQRFRERNRINKTKFDYSSALPTFYNNLGIVLGFKPTRRQKGTIGTVASLEPPSSVSTLSDSANGLATTSADMDDKSGVSSGLKGVKLQGAAAIYTLCGPYPPSFEVCNYIFIVLDDYQQAQASDTIIESRREREPGSMPAYHTSAYFKKATSPFLPGKSKETAVPTKPPELTQAQLYTINAVNKAKSQVVRCSTKRHAHILAMVPFGTGKETDGHRIALCRNQFTPVDREYFGPTKLSKFEISLTNEKGVSLELNGQEWSCVLKAESLYQY